jgi:hypothetical protein
MLVEHLGRALLPYTQPPAHTRAKAPPPLTSTGPLTPGQPLASVTASTNPPPPLRVMPTRAALEAAGRRDLAHLVGQAGGYSAVAASLGWAALRRPTGKDLAESGSVGMGAW